MRIAIAVAALGLVPMSGYERINSSSVYAYVALYVSRLLVFFTKAFQVISSNLVVNWQITSSSNQCRPAMCLKDSTVPIL